MLGFFDVGVVLVIGIGSLRLDLWVGFITFIFFVIWLRVFGFGIFFFILVGGGVEGVVGRKVVVIIIIGIE